MYIVSACLAGINCRYDGGNKEHQLIKKLVEEGKAIPLCPELLGGLKAPRDSSEIVLDSQGQRRVLTKKGKDVTKEFIAGANKTLQIARIVQADTAILKANSPSCGYGKIYDGSFKGRLIKGNGITAELLSKNGLQVYTEEEMKNFK